MKYILNKKEVKFELVSFPDKIEGLDITPQNKKDDSPFVIKNITLVDNKLVKSFILQKINKKFDKLLKLINKILGGESDDDNGDAKQTLDEIQKMKSMLVNKYKAYLHEKQYKEILSKLILMEEEFKIRFNERILYKQLMYMDYTEEKNISR